LSDHDTTQWLRDSYYLSFPEAVEGSGNILGYLSNMSGETVVVELHSGFYALEVNLRKRYLNSCLRACLYKCVILRPVDVVFLASPVGIPYALNRVSDQTHILAWGNDMNNLISQLEEGTWDGKINAVPLLEAMANYLGVLLTQLVKEDDSAKDFEMITKSSNPRLIAEQAGDDAIKLMQAMPKLLTTQKDLVGSILRRLLWSPSNASLNNITESIARLINMDKAQVSSALKWANLAFHTEVQCIVLRILQTSDAGRCYFSPTRSPLISLQNPCTSCFRLPYIFSNSTNDFFYFVLCDDFYESYPHNLLPQKYNLRANKRQSFKSDVTQFRLRPWLGPDVTARNDIEHAISEEILTNAALGKLDNAN
jgi:hypothetical protein